MESDSESVFVGTALRTLDDFVFRVVGSFLTFRKILRAITAIIAIKAMTTTINNMDLKSISAIQI